MTISFNGMLFDRALICASCGAALAAVIVAALALFVGRFVRGRPAPLRYGLLLAALVVLGIVPAVAAASRLGGWGALRVSPSAVDRPLATRPLIARPEMLRPSPSQSPAPTQVAAAAADDHFSQPAQTPHREKTAAAALRMPTLREAASGLLWAWLGGLLFFVGMVFRDLVRLKRLRQTLVPCSSPAAVALLGEAARSVGLTQPPRLFESAAVPVPVVIGPVNPVVVLPAGMANTLDREKLTAILLHEAAHVVHGDLWVGLLQHAVAAIFWWCPPVHRLNRRLAEVREEICDDYVVLAQGDGFQLAEVLVEMAAGLQGRRQRLTIGTLGAIDEKPALEGRVERLIDLTRQAAPMTRMNRLAVVAAGAFGVVALAIVLATTIHAADEPPAAAPKAAAAPLGAAEAKEPQGEAAASSRKPEQAKAQVPPFTLTGAVVDKSGKPVPGAVITTRNYRGIIQATATADDQGAFEITLPMSPFARASLGPIVSAAVSDRPLLGYFRFPFHDGRSPGSDKVRIVIEPTRPAKVNVIDADGKPVEGAEVRMQLDLPISIGPSETDASGVATFQVPQSETIMSVIALKDHQGLDYEVYSLPQAQQGDQFAQRPEFPFAAGQTLILDGASPLAMRAEDGQGKPLPDVNSHVWLLRKEGRHDVMNLSFYIGLDQTTDASGSLTFAWFPKWQTEPVTIWSHATGYEHQRTNHLPTARSETVTVSMQQLIPLRGSVTLPDGKPAANIPVAAHGAGYSFDRCNASGKTDEAGRYEIFVAPNQTYMLTIADEQWAAPAQSGFVVLPGQEVPEHDFTLRPATRIHGRVLNRSTSQPVAGQLLYLNQQGISLNDIGKDLLPNPGNLNVWVCPNWQQGKTAGRDGGFEFFVAEGEYNLFTTGQTGERFVIGEESEKEIDLRIDVAAPKVLTGIVTQADTQAPVSDALIVLYPSQTTSPFEQKATSTADGRFSIETKAGPAHAFVLDKKAGLGAIAEVGAEQTSVDLPLLKLGSAHGRLLTEDGSQPAAGVKLIYAVRITDPIDKTSLLRFGGEVTTDSDGTFTLPYLVPGWDYECVCNDYPGGAILGVAKVNVQPGESQSLGDRTKPAAPKPYVPPTLEERTLAAFRATKTPLERLEKAKKCIQDGHNNLLVVWGNPDDARVKDLMRIRFEDKAFQAYNNDYVSMSVSTATDSLEAARELATALDMPVAPSETDLLLAILDENGAVVARLAGEEICAGGSIAKDLFFAELDRHKPTPLDAHELLKMALATAQRENKRVMLLETATWCGPCQILSGWLQRNQQWEKDYVWVKIDQRWTGATEIMKELRGEDRSIPWVGILDAEGKPLATSDNPASGSNIGNPTTSPELDHFRHMFESTCQRMTPEEIADLVKAAVVEVGR